MAKTRAIERTLVVYLAGGMRSGWQDEVMRKVQGVIFIDPRNHGLTTEDKYTAWDLAGVDRADVVFGYLEADNPGGAGLALEFGWAAKAGKHIILAQDAAHPQARYYGMVRQVADAVFDQANPQTELQQAINYLKKFAALKLLEEEAASSGRPPMCVCS